MRNLTEFGAFVEVEEEIDGLIHISDMSWSKRIKHPSEAAPEIVAYWKASMEAHASQTNAKLC